MVPRIVYPANGDGIVIIISGSYKIAVLRLAARLADCRHVPSFTIEIALDAVIVTFEPGISVGIALHLLGDAFAEDD